MRIRSKIAIPVIIVCIAAGGLIYAQRYTGINKTAQEQPSSEALTPELIQELKDVALRIDTAKNILLEGEYTVNEYGNGDRLDSEPLTYVKTTEGIYSAVGGLEQVFIDGHVASINNYLKLITLSKPGKRIKTGDDLLRSWQLFIEGINRSGTRARVNDKGATRTIVFDTDSTEQYQPYEIIYDPSAKTLQSYSLLTKMMVPGNMDDMEKQVVLKMTISKYGEIGKNNVFFEKIQWKKKEVTVTDSLKNYQLQFLE